MIGTGPQTLKPNSCLDFVKDEGAVWKLVEGLLEHVVPGLNLD